MPQYGATGKNLGHLYSCHLVIPSVYLKNSSSCGDFKGKSLPLLNDYWGKHCALITSMDKLSRAQVGQFRPYPTLPYPYPTLPYPTLPYPTLPYPTPILPFPYPTPFPTPYLTLPYPLLYPTPYHTLLYPTLPYPTLIYQTLQYPTSTRPYPTPAI